MAYSTAEKVADWFLLRSKEDFISGISDEQITNLKLQKLLYYAQGCVLAITGAPLFDDDLEAWAHGPVVPKIYHKYKSNGSNSIEPDNGFDPDSISPEIIDILETVYQEFGQYSAWKLRNMTHEEKPWIETPKNGIISKFSMQKYFKEVYVEQ